MQTATEVGGDYYDFYKASDGALTMVIGDATGHGAQAGTMVTATKSLFNLLSREEDIAEILNHINFSIKKMRLPNLFMAMALVRLQNGNLELAGAGMPPALIYRAASGLVESCSLKGLPLGSVANHPYSKTSVPVNTGDTVVLMSDGLPELFNNDNEMFGYENVIKLFSQVGNDAPEKIIEHFTATASNWINGGKQQDDMTFIVFKMK
jgi:serine phosphatase RsbU (regulator of sigma subunit)